MIIYRGKSPWKREFSKEMHQSRSNELNGAGKGALLLLPAADFA
jgi:hypothetical protein